MREGTKVERRITEEGINQTFLEKLEGNLTRGALFVIKLGNI